MPQDFRVYRQPRDQERPAVLRQQRGDQIGGLVVVETQRRGGAGALQQGADRGRKRRHVDDAFQQPLSLSVIAVVHLSFERDQQPLIRRGAG